jgi:hypothetical protein
MEDDFGGKRQNSEQYIHEQFNPKQCNFFCQTPPTYHQKFYQHVEN